MDIKLCASLSCRLFFIASFLLLLLAVVEKVTNLAGSTFLGGSYTPGRLLEFAGVMLLFVIALLLRDIREKTVKPT